MRPRRSEAHGDSQATEYEGRGGEEGPSSHFAHQDDGNRLGGDVSCEEEQDKNRIMVCTDEV